MSSKKKKVLRILGLLTAITVLTTTVPMAGFSVQTKSSLTQQIQSLDSQIKEKEQKLQEIKDQQGETKAYQEVLQGLVNDSMARIDNLAAQMDQQDAEIASLDDKISTLNAEIQAFTQEIDQNEQRKQQLEDELSQKEKDIEESYEVFGQRVRAMYMTGNASLLTQLLNATDYADFLYRSQVVKSISEHDQQLIDDIRRQADEIQSTKDEIEQTVREINDKKKQSEDKRAEQEQARSDVQAKRDESAVLMDQYNAEQDELSARAEENRLLLAQLEGDESAALTNIATLSASKEEAEEDLKDLENPPVVETPSGNESGGGSSTGGGNNNSGSDNDPSGSGSGNGSQTPTNPPASNIGFIWPTPGYAGLKYITSYFGNRNDPFTGELKGHGAIDISGAGIYRSEIVAAASGTVVKAAHGNTGYGNHVIIDHGVMSDGNRYYTLYGHCNSLAVSVGQTVSQGQVIGYVGSTGYSTGPHLHFEVRKGANNSASRVNPLLYLPT
nr:peptidoglycan DD-metalloendopeptidase family protein [uncultured Solibaculum sp.]